MPILVEIPVHGRAPLFLHGRALVMTPNACLCALSRYPNVVLLVPRSLVVTEAEALSDAAAA